MTKLSVLFIAPFPPPIHGASMVSQQIKESRLINETFDGDYVNISASRKMTEIGGYQIVKIFRILSSYFIVLWKLVWNRYDLCYVALTCHGKSFLKDAPYVLLCKMFHRKIVIHQHNKGMSNDVNRPIFHWLFPLVYRNVKVILLSWHLYPDIEKVVKRENVMICPNGIKPTADPNFVHTPNKIPHIFFLSNLLIDKGVLVLLDALKILNDKGCSFVCDFVGSETRDISAQRFAEEVEKRGLNKIAIYHGRKYGAEKDVFWQKADMFVFPTYYECFPLVLLEAMEKGVPCISTAEGGIPDIVEDGVTGLLVPKKDADALAVAIEQMIVNLDLRTQMGQAGRKKFEKLFTEGQFEKTMVNSLKTAINVR